MRQETRLERGGRNRGYILFIRLKSRVSENGDDEKIGNLMNFVCKKKRNRRKSHVVEAAMETAKMTEVQECE